MSSIKFPPNPRTLAEIAVQAGPDDNKSCGCHVRGEPGRWWLCSYHLGVDEGFDERQEVINDLRIRVDQAVAELETLIEERGDELRRRGKIEGLKLVKDWLRSYE